MHKCLVKSINFLHKSFEIPTEELRGLLIQVSQVAFKVGSYICGNRLHDGSAPDVSAPDCSAPLFQLQDFSAPRLFSSMTFQPQDFSAPRLFSSKTFQLQDFSAPIFSAPRLFSSKTFQLLDVSAPRLFSPRCFSSCNFSNRIWIFMPKQPHPRNCLIFTASIL